MMAYGLPTPNLLYPRHERARVRFLKGERAGELSNNSENCSASVSIKRRLGTTFFGSENEALSINSLPTPRASVMARPHVGPVTLKQFFGGGVPPRLQCSFWSDCVHPWSPVYTLLRLHTAIRIRLLLFIITGPVYSVKKDESCTPPTVPNTSHQLRPTREAPTFILSSASAGKQGGSPRVGWKPPIKLRPVEVQYDLARW